MVEHFLILGADLIDEGYFHDSRGNRLSRSKTYHIEALRYERVTLIYEEGADKPLDPKSIFRDDSRDELTPVWF